jgi:hypothetical protein
VLRLRSVKSIVIAPASTGRERRRRMAVIKTAQGNRGIKPKFIPNTRRLIIVLMKLTAPSKEEIPAK